LLSLKKEIIMTAEQSKVSWTELAVGLYEKLNERNAEINYDFQQFEIQVPSGVGSASEHALWVANGRLKISTSERA
jgi:hypothetical protein